MNLLCARRSTERWDEIYYISDNGEIEIVWLNEKSLEWQKSEAKTQVQPKLPTTITRTTLRSENGMVRIGEKNEQIYHIHGV